MAAGWHEASFHVQLDAEMWRTTEAPRVGVVRAVAMTQKRPSRQKPGTVLVKLTVRVPDAAFLPLRPEAVIVIPESMAVLEPLEVEASEPDGEA